MKLHYENQQDKSEPMNGKVIVQHSDLTQLLEDRRNYRPFVARLSGGNGFKLMVGISRNLGCIQYSSSTGDPPYLMAASRNPPLRSGYLEFMAGGTLTPCAARYIITFDELKTVVLDFLGTGKRSNAVLWQELDPKAIRKDVERQSCR